MRHHLGLLRALEPAWKVGTHKSSLWALFKLSLQLLHQPSTPPRTQAGCFEMPLQMLCVPVALCLGTGLAVVGEV